MIWYWYHTIILIGAIIWTAIGYSAIEMHFDPQIGASDVLVYWTAATAFIFLALMGKIFL